MALSATNLAEYLDAVAAASNAGNKSHPILGYPSSFESSTGPRYHTMSEVDDLARKAQTYYTRNGLKPAGISLGNPKHEADQAPENSVLGICAPGTIEWAATFIAVVRLGYTVLALSPRLAPESLEALLSRSKCRVLIHEPALLTGNSSLQATENLACIPVVGESDLLVISLAEEARLGGHQLLTLTSLTHTNVPTTAFIWHSSGSTGIPKLLYVSQKTCMSRIRNTLASSRPGSTFITSAIYNSAGLTFFISVMAQENTTIFHWDDRLPLTSEGLVSFMEESRPDLAILNPMALELILGFVTIEPEPSVQDGSIGNREEDRRRRKRGISVLKSCSQGVASFGAVCPQDVGDRVVREGVTNFHTGYAMSEAGRIMSSGIRPKEDTEWEYMSIWPGIKNSIYMAPFITSLESKTATSVALSASATPQQKKSDKEEQERQTDLYECIILPSNPNLDPSVTNTSDPEPGSLATGDIFQRHPTKPDRWKIIGRRDDQIHVGVGGSVNALEYENLVKAELTRNDSKPERDGAEVEEVVVFGQGRAKLGILVFPKNVNMSDDMNETKDREKMIRDRVWDAVQVMINNKMRFGIDRDMIVVVHSASLQSDNQSQVDQSGQTKRTGVVPRTDKQNFIRPRIHDMYGKEINRAYASAAS